MAILNFSINHKEQSKMDIKLTKHKGEKETDLSFKWAVYSMNLAIQLHFNQININPLIEDQGAKIHFLSAKIMKTNNLDETGYLNEDSQFMDNFLFDAEENFDDEENDYFGEDSGSNRTDSFEPDSIEEAVRVLYENDDYVNILLDLVDASKIVGGFTTPTAESARAIHEATKKHAKSRD